MSLFSSSLESLRPESLKSLSHHLYGLLQRHIWAKVLIGFVLGIGTGMLLAPGAELVTPAVSKTITEWLAFPGHLFLRLVQMVVIPLIVASVIRGIASSENLDQLKKLGITIGLYFLATTIVALFIGAGIASLIEPGGFIDVEAFGGKVEVSAAPVGEVLGGEEKVQDKILGLLPQNPLIAMSESNMLQIVFFALLIGIALISIKPEQGQPVLDLLGSLQEVCMTIVKWAMVLAPFAVFGLTADMVTSVGLNSLLGLGAYVGTVLSGLFLILVFYLCLVAVLGRRNPFQFWKSILNVQLLAFSTSSSAAVMPLSIKTAEENLKIRGSVAQFVVPLGATVNMDGTAIYQMIATLFLAQVYGVDLTGAQLFLVGMTSVGASIGSPGTPGVGIVILASILSAVGIPLEGVGIIVAVDRILDMSRTAVNVTGDLTAALVLDRFMKRED